MKSLNWLIWFCAALFVAVALIPTLLYQTFWGLFTGRDAAAWVQAVGSIAAIFGTGLLGVFQIREGRKAASKARAHALADQHQGLAGVWSSAIGIIVRAEGALRPLVENAPNPAERQRWAYHIEPMVGDLVDLQGLLRSFPTYLFANARATLELTTVLTSLRTAEQAMRRIAEAENPAAFEYGEALTAILTHVRDQVAEAIACLEAEWTTVHEAQQHAVAEALSG